MEDENNQPGQQREKEQQQQVFYEVRLNILHVSHTQQISLFFIAGGGRRAEPTSQSAE